MEQTRHPWCALYELMTRRMCEHHKIVVRYYCAVDELLHTWIMDHRSEFLHPLVCSCSCVDCVLSHLSIRDALEWEVVKYGLKQESEGDF